MGLVDPRCPTALSLSGGNYTGTILENYGVRAPVVGLLIDMGCTIGVGSGSAQCTDSVPGTHPHAFHVVSLQRTECQSAQQVLPTHTLLQAAALVQPARSRNDPDSPLMMIEAVMRQSVYRDAKPTVLASATNCSAVNVYFSAGLQTVKHVRPAQHFMREQQAATQSSVQRC